MGGVVQKAHVKQHFFIDGSQQQVAGGGTISLRWENKSLVSRYEATVLPMPSLHKRLNVMLCLLFSGTRLESEATRCPAS